VLSRQTQHLTQLLNFADIIICLSFIYCLFLLLNRVESLSCPWDSSPDPGPWH